MSGMSVVKYQQPKRKSDTQSALDSNNVIYPPVDFSFCRIGDIAEATDEEPRPPVSPRYKGKQPPPAEDGSKSSSKCLKLNNNNITNLECLIPFVQAKFINWQEIAWIDLSHNEIQKIGPEITEVVNLQILYLHGNQISDPAQIDQLLPLKCLRKITLHGNPLENIKGYRWLILSKLPQLHCLDFSSVTKADAKTSHTWDKMNSWGMKKKKKQVEED